MAANKNQHYVPKVHFKPFTDAQAGNSISLYNVKSRKFIYDAPTRGQCSRSYFYGKKLDLEHTLSRLETKYASDVQVIEKLSGNFNMSTDWLKLFWCVQWCRTEGAMREAKEAIQGSFRAFDTEDPTAESPDDMWVSYTMSAISDALDSIYDLGFCIVRNQSNIPFITSDDPAILTNRLHLVKPKWRGRPFGMQSAGTILLLPVSPRSLLIFYDKDMYSLPSFIRIKSDHDALALNEHQLLKCQHNVYFNRNADHEWIPHEVSLSETQRNRPELTHRVAVLESADRHSENYRFVSARDKSHQNQGIVVSTNNRRAPRRWPTFLKWHLRPQAFDTHTSMGFIRSAFAKRYLMINSNRVRVPL